MPLRYRDLFNLNIKYIEYLLEKSLLSHQYIHNISQSGSDVENEVRQIFKNILPERFKVTHGYIANAPSKSTEPNISPQVDIIIVDTLFPHSLFIVDKTNGLEIVPKEAVVAVFEIKRTLTNESLASAIEHISQISQSVNLTKFATERFMPGGISMQSTATIQFSGGYTNNPMLGIISLDNNDTLVARGHAHEITNQNVAISNAFIDIVCCLKGFLLAVSDLVATNQALRIANPRTTGEKVNYLLISTNNTHTQARVLATAFGYILHYIQNTTGKVPNLSNYFLNDTLNQQI